MFTTTSLLVPLVLLLCVASTATGQWRQIPGTDTTSYAVASVDAEHVYIGTQIGEMRRSSDGGQTWQSINSGLPDSSIFITLYQEPGLLLLCTGKGVYRSTDNGDAWSRTGAELTGPYTCHQVMRYGRYLVIASDSGVGRSTDLGLTWERIQSGLPSGYGSQALAFQDSTLYLGLRSRGIYRSADSGKTWRSSSNGIGPKSIESIGIGSSFMLAGTAPGYVLYRSIDRGISWVNIDSHLPKHVGFVFKQLFRDGIIVSGRQ